MSYKISSAELCSGHAGLQNTESGKKNFLVKLRGRSRQESRTVIKNEVYGSCPIKDTSEKEDSKSESSKKSCTNPPPCRINKEISYLSKVRGTSTSEGGSTCWATPGNPKPRSVRRNKERRF